jgi:guanylate kinase
MSEFDPYDRKPNPLLLVISGPSGVGKDVTIQSLKDHGYPFYFVVTATSRPQRKGEVHGRDYFFVSKEEFETMIEQNDLLEYALVYDQYKGIPKDQIRKALDSDLDVIVRVDVQGAATVRRLIPGAVLIFLMPESDEELVNRLEARSSESPEHLRRRVEMARQEIQQIEQFDYVIVNRHGCLEDTVERLVAVILAEKCRVRQREVRL